MKYRAATPNMQMEPKMAAALGHKMMTMIGGLKCSQETRKLKIERFRVWSRALWDVHHVDGHFLVMWSAFRESGDWSNEFDEAAANGNFEGQDDY